MNIKNCFIKGAGIGSRMGEIGKLLPKVIWPLFEKTLLELQIDYAKSLGCENFWVNTHHEAKLVSELIKIKNLNIIEMYENQLLDSGGCFVNLKNYAGGQTEFLFLNSDIIYFLSGDELNSGAEILREKGVCLFGLSVDKASEYNKTVVDNGVLTKIIAPENEFNNYWTYSGMGLINLDSINNEAGPSRFFKEICNPSTDEVGFLCPSSGEYWDFGTKKLYIESMFKVLKRTDSKLYNFLKNNNYIIDTKMKDNSYNSEFDNIINLGTLDLGRYDKKARFINMGGVVSGSIKDSLHYYGLFN